MRIVALFFLFANLPAAAESEISGVAHVVDSDTIHVIADSGLARVRLRGMAAPDSNHPGGKEAKEFLERQVEGKPVRCVLDGDTLQNGEIWICYAEGKDIAATVIRAGLARDCPAFSGGRYWSIERPEAQKLVLPDDCTADGPGSMRKPAGISLPHNSARRR